MNGRTAPNTLQGGLEPALDRCMEILRAALPWEVYAKVAVVRADGTLLAATGAEHVASSQRLVEAFDAAFGGRWRPGDAALSNDVDLGCAHVCEIAAVAPFWSGDAEAAPAGFFLVRVQAPDLGGWELGGYSRQATDRWAEAARFQPAYMTLGGRPRREVREMLSLNSRAPRTMERLISTIQDALSAGVEAIDRAAAADPSFLKADSSVIAAADQQTVTDLLKAVPEGRFEGESDIPSPFTPGATLGTVRAVVTRDSSGLEIELEAPRLLGEPINLTPTMTCDIALGATLAALGAPPMSSAAVLNFVRVSISPNSLLAAALPYPTGLGRETAGQAVYRAVASALTASGTDSDPETLWQVYRDRWIGPLLDWDNAGLAADVARRIRAFEQKEARV